MDDVDYVKGNIYRMKIALKNFRTHIEREWELPDSGLVLLKGNSGIGKTTLLRAIQWALYGNVRSVSTFGTTSSSVELNVNGLNIKRQKGPKRLIVNDVEGDHAQGIINNLLNMNDAEFMASSYIQQKNQHSLLTLEPAQQLAFIERLAFTQYSPEKFKASITQQISERKQLIEKHKDQRAFLQKFEEEKQQQKQKIEEQIIYFEFAFREDEIIEVAKKCAELNEKIQNFRDIIEMHTKELNCEGLQLADNIGYLETEISSLYDDRAIRVLKLKEDYKGCGDSWLSCTEEFAVAKIYYYELCIKFNKIIAESQDWERIIANDNKLMLKLKQDYQALDLTIDALKLNEEKKQLELDKTWLVAKKALSSEMTFFFNTLFSSSDNFGSMSFQEKFIKADGLIHGDIIAMEELHTQFTGKVQEETQRLYELEKAKKQYNCPVCNTKVSLINETLVTTTIDVQSAIESVKQYLDQVKSAVKETENKLFQRKQTLVAFNELKRKFTDFKDFDTKKTPTMEEMVARIDQIIGDLFTASLQKRQADKIIIEIDKLKKSLELSQKTLDDIEQKGEEFIDTNKFEPKGITTEDASAEKSTWQEYTYTQRSNANKKREILAEINEKPATIITKEEKLADMKARYEICKPAKTKIEIHKNIENLQETINIHKQKQIFWDVKAQQVQKFKEELAINEKIYQAVDVIVDAQKDSIKQIKQLEKDEAVAISMLEASYALKKYSDEAQMNCVSSIVESINIAAKTYLDMLFPDEPCVVNLLPYKANKDGNSVRPKLSLQIQYKGFEYDDIEDISGGENDRVVLAYQLALNSLYNSPFLLLDEAFTGVEDSLFMGAMDALKVVSQSKLILVVSHGANEGIFDNVVDI